MLEDHFDGSFREVETRRQWRITKIKLSRIVFRKRVWTCSSLVHPSRNVHSVRFSDNRLYNHLKKKECSISIIRRQNACYDVILEFVTDGLPKTFQTASIIFNIKNYVAFLSPQEIALNLLEAYSTEKSSEQVASPNNCLLMSYI